MSKMNSWRFFSSNWSLFSVLIYCISVVVSLPPMRIEEKGHQLLSPPTTDHSSNQSVPYGHAQWGSSMTVGQPRQLAFLAALGTAVAPFFANLIAPILSALATAVSNAILGKLQGFSHEVNYTTTDPLHYEAYMINVPNEPGPYLLLTNNNNGDLRRPNTVTSMQPQQTLNRRPQPHIEQPSLKVTQHLGTVNIKPYAPFNAERQTVSPDNLAYTNENQQEELDNR